MHLGYWYRENLSHVLIFRGCRGVVVERCVLYGKVSGSIPAHSQSIRNDRNGKYLTTSPLRMEITTRVVMRKNVAVYLTFHPTVIIF